MPFYCENGTRHSHETVEQSKACWGIIPAPVVSASPAPSVSSRVPATVAQIKYATDLGGDPAKIASYDKPTMSSYIRELLREKKKAKVSTPVAATPVPPPPPPYVPPVYVPPSAPYVPPKPLVDTRLEFAKGMLMGVQDGYYAVRKEEGASVFFLRVSRPKHGKQKGALKVQSMHGTAASKPSLMDALVVWPSERYTFYGRYRQDHWREKLVDSILLLVTDIFGAAMLYSAEIGRCCRCNAALTDDRSRHYGIGPECEKYWPHIIELVTENKGSYRG